MHFPRFFLFLFLITSTFGGLFAPPRDDRDEMLRKMDERAERYGDLSRRIWEIAEVGYKEKQSAELLKSELRAAGFQIQENVGEIPTAFSASFGNGKPVIGI